ncbi:MAG TPA: HAMP domain-containing sensor histidine kinase [Sphingobium sp.]
MAKVVRSAAYRIALVYALGFAIATLALGFAIMLVAHFAFMRQLEAQIVEDSNALLAEYRLEGHGGLNFAIGERQAGSRENELLYAVFTRSGRRVIGDLDARRPPLGWSDLSFTDPQEGPDEARAWTVGLPDGARLVVGADRSVVERVDQTLGIILAAGFAVILVMSLLGALILGSYLRRRLAAISVAADGIMADAIEMRLPESDNQDEFDALARSLNRMLDRIAMLLDNLRQVSSDVAHDLRTPLARLRGHLEQSLVEADENSTGHRGHLEFALTQTDDLLALFASILRISEIEGGARKASFLYFNLSALVVEIAESYVPVIEDGGRTLTSHICLDALVYGDRELLAQALINLLDNAQIHTPAGTNIALVLARSGGEVSLSVRDNGPGVPADAHSLIFRRFMRLDRGRTIPGHGLGLNLVAAIVAAHDGTVDVSDNAPGLCIGFRMTAMPSNGKPALDEAAAQRQSSARSDC